ncbi:MAG TPA: hypothetical protein V6D34_11750 [Candidatus Sericytochromatia bacterium]
MRIENKHSLSRSLHVGLGLNATGTLTGENDWQTFAKNFAPVLRDCPLHRRRAASDRAAVLVSTCPLLLSVFYS